MSTPASHQADVAVIRLLLMDTQRKQIALCQHPTGSWQLPCGLQPDHETPLEALDTMAYESQPDTVLAALREQLEANKPVAWIYPPASVAPEATGVLHIMYLLTLDTPEQFACQSPPNMLYSEHHRFWSMTHLPDNLAPLDALIIQTVRFAESRQALPIDMRAARPLSSGQPQAIAKTRTLVEANAITSPTEARKAASSIQTACVENWNGRAFNVYCKRNLTEEYGIRITRARMREGNLQVYGLDEGRWITNPAIVYQMV